METIIVGICAAIWVGILIALPGDQPNFRRIWDIFIFL